MSHWVYLVDRTAPPWCDFGQHGEDACPEPCYPAVQVERFEAGATVPVGGTTEAEVSVTYNYAASFRTAWNAIGGTWSKDASRHGTLGSMLDGRVAVDTIDELTAAAGWLGTERDLDYWKPTAGNAGATLALLLSWAKQHPSAIWVVH